MVAKSNIEEIRALVKDESTSPDYVHTFPDYREAIKSAQNLADLKGIRVYLREIIHRTDKQDFYKCGTPKSRITQRRFALWLKRGSSADIEVKPSALSRRPVVGAKELEEQAEIDEQFRVKMQTAAWELLRSDDPEASLQQFLGHVHGERQKGFYQTYEALRKEVADATRDEQVKYVTNDQLRHYAITRQLGKPEYPEWKAPARLSQDQWTRLANEGKVSLGSMKKAVESAIERITRTGRAAKWSSATRPAMCTVAKHLRRGDWWCLEDMRPAELDQDTWHVVETIHYNPSARYQEDRFWRQPWEQKTQSVSWAVEVSTYDGHLISRTVQAASGYSAEQKMKAILAEAGMGGFHVTDVQQADADSFDSIDLSVLEQGTLDHFEEEYEIDYDLIDSLS
jgi:hypothetical protein